MANTRRRFWQDVPTRFSKTKGTKGQTHPPSATTFSRAIRQNCSSTTVCSTGATNLNIFYVSLFTLNDSYLDGDGNLAWDRDEAVASGHYIFRYGRNYAKWLFHNCI